MRFPGFINFQNNIKFLSYIVAFTPLLFFIVYITIRYNYTFLCVSSVFILSIFFVLRRSFYSYLFSFIVLFCISIAVTCFLLVRKSTGFSLDLYIVEALSIASATNINEIFSFLKTVGLYPFSPLAILILVPFVVCDFKKRKKVTYVDIIVPIFCLALFCIPKNFFINKSICRLMENMNIVIESNSKINEKNDFVWGAKNTLKQKTVSIVVLGETTRGLNSSINGYDRITTPYIEKENVISFSNAISLGAHTLAATPFILTRKPLDYKGIFPEKSVFSAYKEAGYKTYYISYLNQVHHGDYDLNQIFSEVDIFIKRKTPYDGEYIEIVKNILNSTEDHIFIVVKLLGSHFNFYTNYPDSFDFFKPSYKTYKFNAPDVSEKEIMLNTYDNSIRYTDYVVGNIIDLLKKTDRDATLTFISDHGICLFDDNEVWGLRQAKPNFNILYFYWLNDIAKNRLRNKVNMLIENKNFPVDASYFLDTQFELNGIVVDKKNGKNLFLPLQKEDERYVLTSRGITKYKDLPE